MMNDFINLELLKRVFKALCFYAVISLFPTIANGSGTVNSGISTGTAVYSNYVADYTNINKDTKIAASAASTALNATGNFLSSLGFFVVTPTISGKFPNITTNYFSVCFGDNWHVSNVTGNSIFNPRISAYNEVIVSCIGWRGSVTLNAFGECNQIGIKRVCARFTTPCQNGNNRCCGSDSCSAPNPNSSSCPNCKQTQAYRICAFEDPAIPFDPNDNNYKLMPFQQNSPAPPAVTGGDNLVALGAVVMAAGLLVPGLGEGTMLIGAAIMLAGGIMDLIQVITSTINYVVIQNVGCIDVPLAPSPPPFFSPLVPPYPTPGVVGICQYSPDYAISTASQAQLLSSGLTQAQINNLQYKQISTSNAICEVGGSLGSAAQYSTFENPAVRIYFSNPLPLCTGPNVNDVCVNGISVETPDSLQQDNMGLLPICSNSIKTNCITFPSNRTTGGPFRTYYNIQNSSALGMTLGGNAPQTTSYVKVDPSLQSLSLAGINDTQYADSAIGNTLTITDTNGTNRTFYVNLDTTGSQVCVTDQTVSSNPTQVNCIPRPLMFNPPVITSCLTKNTCQYTGSENLSAQPRMSVSLGSPAKTSIIGVDTMIPNPNSTITPQGVMAPKAFCVQDDIVTAGNSTSKPSPCYIYGAQFGAYITDNNNQTPATSSNGTITPYAAGGGYTTGIQYYQGNYCSNGIRLSFSMLITITCPFIPWFMRDSWIMPICPYFLPNS
jgi:hypothetical protein